MERRWCPGIAGVLLIAGCADSTAVQNFAKTAPPEAQYRALLLDHASMLALEPVVSAIQTQRPIEMGRVPASATTFCSNVPALARSHTALIAYIKFLGDAATAGTTMVPASTYRPPAAPATKAKLAPCPPPSIPVDVSTASAAVAGSVAVEKAPVTAAELSTDLQNIKSIGVRISKADADAAATLVVLIESTATAAARDAAVKADLDRGRAAFKATILIETQVMGYVADEADSYRASLVNLRQSVENGMASIRPSPVAQSIGLRFLLASYPTGPLANAEQAAQVSAAATAYVKALKSISDAFDKIDSAANSGNVLTAATWTTIQPLIEQAIMAYQDLAKL